MDILLNIVIAAVVAFVAKFILELIGMPGPFPMLVALIVFLVLAFRDHLGIGRPRI